jgi:D-cysteine desulfhydrase
MRIHSKINLANIPTPLHKIYFDGKEFFMKRDDMTGIELSGNKVRKLEYILSSAKNERAEYIFTCGGEQSNHARATVVAASQLGFRTKLFLWGKKNNSSEGNLFFDKYFGSEITYLTKKEYENVNEIMTDERTRMIKKGKRVFVIPEGGSTTTGINGYSDFVDELQNQIDLKVVKGIVTAAGTGGTAAGILAGLSYKNSEIKVYAVNVLYPKEIITRKILTLAEACILENKFKGKLNHSNLVVLDGYSSEGYKKITKEKLNLIRRFANSSGIILDPAYTGKAFAAYYENFILKNKSRQNIFLHTGGIWGVMNKRAEYLSA